MTASCQYAFFSEKGSSPFQEDLVYAEPESNLFIVCDGLGTKGSGIEASQIAADKIRDSILTQLPNFAGLDIAEKSVRQKLLSLIDQGVQSASKAIFEHAKTHTKYAGNCSSVDLFLQVEDRAFIGHIGPGRIYLIRSGETHQLTEDHTQLAHYKRIGRLEEFPIDQHAVLAKRLTRAVGFQDSVKVDLLELELQEGDRIFLCTDGVWHSLDEQNLETAFVAHDLELCKAQILAGINSSKDNFSAILLSPSVTRQQLAESSAEQKIRLTGKISLFRYLSYQELIKVVSVAELFKAKANTTLCNEGEISGEMMIILSGSAEARKAGVHLSTLKKGDVFGEMSMIDTAPRSATIVALEASSFLAFPRDAFFALLREDPVLSVKFMWGLCQEMNKRIRNLSNKLTGSTDPLSPEKMGGKLPFFYSKDVQ